MTVPIVTVSESGVSESFDPDAFAALAAERLRPEPPGPLEQHSNPNGDHALDGKVAVLAGPPKAAAVLVPVILRDETATVLLTQRAPNLRSHSGQIAFPGGRVDPEDSGPLGAALREAEEEIGLDPALVRPVGFLDPYLTGTGYLVIPAVGLVSAPVRLALNPAEVAEVFEVPLAFLMDAGRHELHSREWQGRQRRYYAIPFGERYIWGVTAGIIRNLYQRLYAS